MVSTLLRTKPLGSFRVMHWVKTEIMLSVAIWVKDETHMVKTINEN